MGRHTRIGEVNRGKGVLQEWNLLRTVHVMWTEGVYSKVCIGMVVTVVMSPLVRNFIFFIFFIFYYFLLFFYFFFSSFSIPLQVDHAVMRHLPPCRCYRQA